MLYISYDGLTDPLGQSQILPYVIGLSKKGYQFELISCEKPDRFEAYKGNIETICRENNINWHPLSYHKKPPVLSTIRDSNSIKKLAFQLHAEKPFDIVHCRSYISSITGLALKKKHNVKFIFDMRGFFADERVDGNLWNLSNPLYNIIYRYFKTMEATYVQFADHIVSLTSSGKKIMEGWPLLKYQDKITVIPCSADMDLFDRKNLDEGKIQALKNEINNDLIVGYYGSLGTWYMMEEMLDQFNSILHKYPKARLLVVTKDEWTNEHDSMLRKRNIKRNQVVLRSSERNQMPYYMAATDVGLFFIKPCYSKQASSPTKHGEMMGVGLPLIANRGIGDVDEIIESTHSGYIVDDFITAEYNKATESIPGILKIPKDTIRNGALEIYSLEKAVDTYYGIYKKITSGKKR